MIELVRMGRNEIQHQVPVSLLAAMAAKGWSEQDTRQGWQELARWMHLTNFVSPLTMFSKQVDEVWHTLIGTDGLFIPERGDVAMLNNEYRDICLATADQLLGHVPGNAKDADCDDCGFCDTIQKAAAPQIGRTDFGSLYLQRFSALPPAKFWNEPAKCSRACQCSEVQAN